MLEEEVVNLRYPHTIRIVRIRKREVESGSVTGTVVDPDDPLAEQGATPINDSEATDVVVETYEDELYNGKGRSYTDTTTNGDGKVDRNKRKVSIPVRYDEWDADRKPLDGDTIYAAVGANTEVGMVRDCEPDNNRSVVYWDFVRV